MGSQSFSVVRVEFQIQGLSLTAVGLIVGAVGAVSRGVGLEIFDLLLGALSFGGVMSWMTLRRVREAFEIARPATGITPESPAQTRPRVVKQSLMLLAVFLLLDLAFRSSVSDGFSLGVGVGLIVIASRMGKWESEHQARLLRRAQSGFKFRWRNEMDANNYRLATDPHLAPFVGLSERGRTWKKRGLALTALGTALESGVMVRTVIIVAKYPHAPAGTHRGPGHGELLGAILLAGIVILLLGIGLLLSVRWSSRRTRSTDSAPDTNDAT